MRGLTGAIGCSATLAAVAFVLGLIGSLFATMAGFGERLLMAGGLAATVFVAVLMLAVRDHMRCHAAFNAVRKMLTARDDVTEVDFLSRFPDLDRVLLGQIRQAVADSFNVPVAKIHPDDNPLRDFRCDALEPGFHSFVVYHILNVREVAPVRGQLFTFTSSSLSGFGDLATEIQRILDDLAGRSAEATG